MRVVLPRTLILGDIRYRAQSDGVEIPDFVNGKQVVLYDEKATKADKEKVYMLPKEAYLYTGDARELVTNPQFGRNRLLRTATDTRPMTLREHASADDLPPQEKPPAPMKGTAGNLPQTNAKGEGMTDSPQDRADRFEAEQRDSDRKREGTPNLAPPNAQNEKANTLGATTPPEEKPKFPALGKK